ncbi:MAG: hypothetical protein WC307_05045 [Candidatus Nanoarchaeia archaeon]|jgi:DeoR/GlpR family transcriptional regulator of sugar metabolism
MYNTKNKQKIIQSLPKKGMINVKQLAAQTKQALETIYYNLKCLSQDNNSTVGRIRIGLKKFKYFIKTRIDKWILQKLQRITKNVIDKLKNVACKFKKSTRPGQSNYNELKKRITVY